MRKAADRAAMAIRKACLNEAGSSNPMRSDGWIYCVCEHFDEYVVSVSLALREGNGTGIRKK